MQAHALLAKLKHRAQHGKTTPRLPRQQLQGCQHGFR